MHPLSDLILCPKIHETSASLVATNGNELVRLSALTNINGRFCWANSDLRFVKLMTRLVMVTLLS